MLPAQRNDTFLSQPSDDPNSTPSIDFDAIMAQLAQASADRKKKKQCEIQSSFTKNLSAIEAKLQGVIEAHHAKVSKRYEQSCAERAELVRKKAEVEERMAEAILRLQGEVTKFEKAMLAKGTEAPQSKSKKGRK
ncbi:hypothetical protein YB2330_003948 [Saitoella coloradoensis]